MKKLINRYRTSKYISCEVKNKPMKVIQLKKEYKKPINTAKRARKANKFELVCQRNQLNDKK